MTKNTWFVLFAVACLLLLVLMSFRALALAFLSTLLWVLVFASIPWFTYRVFLRPRMRARRIAQIRLDRALRERRERQDLNAD